MNLVLLMAFFGYGQATPAAALYRTQYPSMEAAQDAVEAMHPDVRWLNDTDAAYTCGVLPDAEHWFAICRFEVTLVTKQQT